MDDHLHVYPSLTFPGQIEYHPCQAFLESVFESISDGVFTVDNEWRITFFNRAAEEMTGVSRKEAYGRPCHEIFRSNMCENSCALRKTMSLYVPFIFTKQIFKIKFNWGSEVEMVR